MTNLNAVIVRQASNDFEAVLTAHAMQSLSHVDVFSVAFSGHLWHVYAKYASDQVTTEDIDRSVDAALRSVQAKDSEGESR